MKEYLKRRLSTLGFSVFFFLGFIYGFAAISGGYCITCESIEQTNINFDLICSIIFIILAIICIVFYNHLPYSKYSGINEKVEINLDNLSLIEEKYNLVKSVGKRNKKKIYDRYYKMSYEKIIVYEVDKISDSILKNINREIDEFKAKPKVFVNNILCILICLNDIRFNEDIELNASVFTRKSRLSPLVFPFILSKETEEFIQCPLMYKEYNDIFHYRKYGKRFYEYLVSLGIIKEKGRY